MFERTFDHFTGIDGGAVDGAMYLVRDQPVFAVEEQQAEFLGPGVAHGNPKVIDQLRP